MPVYHLQNQYVCYCTLVGKVRYQQLQAEYERPENRNRGNQADHISPEGYQVSKAEFVERITQLEWLFAISVKNRDRWYKLPLQQIWKRIEGAKRDGRRLVS